MVKTMNMALCAAAKEAGITQQEMRNTLVSHGNGLFEISFSTEWMSYDCYVDEETLEVLGFDYKPVPLNTLLGSLPESRQHAS